MTTSFSLEHEFQNISLEKFVSHLNDPKLNRMLEKERLFDERSLIEKSEDKNGDKQWEFLVKKHGELPAAIKKFIPADGLAWKEISRYVAKEHCIYWEIIPEAKVVKFSGSGVWRLCKAGHGCKRIIEGKVSVEIPLVGKIIESYIVNELKSTYEIEPHIQEKFYASIS